MLKIIFMVSGLLFALAIIIFKLFIKKQKDMMKASHFLAGMAIFMAVYVISGILLVIFLPNMVNKLAVLLFALSPFIIGKLAAYEKEELYSFIQVFCVLISIAFIVIRG